MHIQHLVFISFDGNCHEAMEFYAKVFKTEMNPMLVYGEIPSDPNIPVQESDKGKVALGDLQFGDVKIHFADRLSSDPPYIIGNNVNVQLFIEGIEEATRVFNELKEGGEVLQELHKPFYAELVGVTADKFGVIWQILGSTPKD